MLLYIYPIYKYNCLRAFIILLNGIFYHGCYPNNQIVRIYDTTINFCIACYTSYYCPKLFKYALLSSELFLLNNLFLYNNYINETQANIVHIIVVHIPFMILLILDNEEKLMII